MATPKVFISSTCYDLRQTRSDLKRFIESYGYEPVLSETHNVTYNIETTLEQDCYTEINYCDIIIGIIGGKFGSEAKNKNGKSVSMIEMESAIEKKKQIYIFIDNDVKSEYDTYQKNIGKNIEYAHVDNVEIFKFIQHLKENPAIIINGFVTVTDITDCLRSQWAGLFQNFLSNNERIKQNEGLVKVEEVSAQIQSLVTELRGTSVELKNTIGNAVHSDYYKRSFINRILIEFADTLLGCKAVVLFKNKSEMEELLSEIGYNFDSENDTTLFYKSSNSKFSVEKKIFDDNNNLIYLARINEPHFTLVSEPQQTSDDFVEIDGDDDLPF